MFRTFMEQINEADSRTNFILFLSSSICWFNFCTCYRLSLLVVFYVTKYSSTLETTPSNTSQYHSSLRCYIPSVRSGNTYKWFNTKIKTASFFYIIWCNFILDFYFALISFHFPPKLPIFYCTRTNKLLWTSAFVEMGIS